MSEKFVASLVSPATITALSIAGWDTMILVYAGRRIDPEDSDVERRFPRASIPRVVQDVDRILRDLGPTTVVGSAACGSDLLVLEAAGRLGMRRRIVLPFDRETLRGSSVTDRPGDWGRRFDAVINDVRARGDLVELTLDPKDDGTYEQANAEIYRQAESLARAAGDNCNALVLWNGSTRGGGDVTEAFLNEARRRGWAVVEIETTKPMEEAR